MFFKSVFHSSWKWGAIPNWIVCIVLVLPSLKPLAIWESRNIIQYRFASLLADWNHQFASTHFNACKFLHLVLFLFLRNVNLFIYALHYDYLWVRSTDCAVLQFTNTIVFFFMLHGKRYATTAEINTNWYRLKVSKILRGFQNWDFADWHYAKLALK